MSFLVYLQAILLDIYLVHCHPKLIFRADDDAYYVRTSWSRSYSQCQYVFIARMFNESRKLYRPISSIQTLETRLLLLCLEVSRVTTQPGKKSIYYVADTYSYLHYGSTSDLRIFNQR